MLLVQAGRRTLRPDPEDDCSVEETRRPSGVLRAASAGVGALLLIGGGAAANSWDVVSVGSAPAIGEAEITFGSDGAVSGTTGCNRFSGSGTVADGTLMVDEPLATTRMACPGDALVMQEDTILGLLAGNSALTFDPFGDRLTLEKDGVVLVLARQVHAEEGAGIPRPHLGRQIPSGSPLYLGFFGQSGDLEIRDAPSVDAAVVGGVSSGTVLRNAGCANGWCEVELPDGSVAGWASADNLEPADSALRAGQGVFDATGLIRCARGDGAPMGECVFGVARDGAGSATVVVTRTDGLQRALFFEDGEFVSTDASQAGGGFDSSATREADLIFIRVDDERYEIPDAVLFGG